MLRSCLASVCRCLGRMQNLVCMDMLSSPQSAPSALITLSTHTLALQAVQLTLADDLVVSPAPYPSDVVPGNAGLSRHLVQWRKAAVDALLAVGLLLWSVPITGIQALVSIEKVQLICGIELDSSSPAYALLTQYLPVAAWLCLLTVLQGLFWEIAELYEGVRTYSEIQLRTMHRFWAFTLCTMYVTVLSGSLLDSLGNVLMQPRSVLLFVGQSMPQVSVYFLSVVISKALLTLPVSLLRPGAVWTLLRRCLGWSGGSEGIPVEEPRDGRYIAINYGRTLPDVLLVFTICVTFAPLAPLIVLAGAMFFGLALPVYRFGALYAWRAPFQGQGHCFSFFFTQALSVLPASVLILCAALTLQGGYAQAFSLLPLLCGTIYFQKGALANLQSQSRLPLTLAQELDSKALQQRLQCLRLHELERV